MNSHEERQDSEDMSDLEEKFNEFFKEVGVTPGEFYNDPEIHYCLVGKKDHDQLPQVFFELMLVNEIDKIGVKGRHDTYEIVPIYVRRSINLGYTKEHILRSLADANEGVRETIVNAFEYITTSLKMDIAPVFHKDLEFFVSKEENVQTNWKLDKLFLEYSIIHNINRGKDLPEILEIYSDDPLYCEAVIQVYYDVYWRSLIYMMKTNMTEEMFRQNYPDLQGIKKLTTDA